MSATNRGAKKREYGWYPTPAPFVRAIMPHLPFAGSVLEPMAGDGAIVRALTEAGHLCVDMIEIDPTRAAALRGMGDDIHVGDALAPEADWLWDTKLGFVRTSPCGMARTDISETPETRGPVPVEDRQSEEPTSLRGGTGPGLARCPIGDPGGALLDLERLELADALSATGTWGRS